MRPTIKQRTQLLLLVQHRCFSNEERAQITSFLQNTHTTLPMANKALYRLIKLAEKRTGQNAKWQYFDFPKA